MTCREHVQCADIRTTHERCWNEVQMFHHQVGLLADDIENQNGRNTRELTSVGNSSHFLHEKHPVSCCLSASIWLESWSEHHQLYREQSHRPIHPLCSLRHLVGDLTQLEQLSDWLAGRWTLCLNLSSELADCLHYHDCYSSKKIVSGIKKQSQ